MTDDGDIADCTVRATAGDCYVLLWNRHDLDDLTGRADLSVDGDPAVLGLWRGEHRIRWS